MTVHRFKSSHLENGPWHVTVLFSDGGTVHGGGRWTRLTHTTTTSVRKKVNNNNNVRIISGQLNYMSKLTCGLFTFTTDPL